MGGLFLCFVVPGIVVGLLLAEGVQQAKQKARVRRKARAKEDQRKLFVYDLRCDGYKRDVTAA